MKEQTRVCLKSWLGPRNTTRLRCLFKAQALAWWGNLRRTKPFSENFGFDRGQPVDRFYLHKFLDENRDAITGDVLEIQGSGYTSRFGKDVRCSHTLDIDASFHATYVCDLAEADGIIPSESYDCFLLPNTAQHLRKLEECLVQALRLVKPGGTILASAAGFLPLTPDCLDYWRLTPAGWAEVTKRVWPDARVTITGHGNCLVAAAAMFGLAGEELTESELETNDRRYPVLTTIRCDKAARHA